MKSYCLNIAEYRIGVTSSEDGPELEPSERFKGSICYGNRYDIEITVHSGRYQLPAGAERVFHAPLLGEVGNTRNIMGENFWSIYSHNGDIFIETILPYSKPYKNAILKFSLREHRWQLWIEGENTTTDPLDYPIDGLILYYLAAINGDIMVHASGVNHAGKGYIFSGVSGTGKTTMAKIWNREGSAVVHDDRLIIRNVGGKYMMFSTPVYRNDVPAQSEVNKIFLINHGNKNRLVQVTGARAVSLFLANCIQHNWNRDLITSLTGSVSAVCSSLPVSQLYFKPGREIIDFILDHEQRK